MSVERPIARALAGSTLPASEIAAADPRRDPLEVQQGWDFKAFATTIHTSLPDCRILYIPIKPSIARQKLRPLQNEANAIIETYCADQPDKLQTLDFSTPLLSADGKLRPELYKKDGLHLNPDGYEIWSNLLRPLVEKP